MFRIDDASAAATLPVPGAAGEEGFFTEGDPASGLPGTRVRADWLNAIQEELRAIVVAGGLTPSKTAMNQVLTAIQALINPGRSLTSNGHYIFPGGLIIQWGAALSTSGADGTTVNFPIPFPNTAIPPVCNTNFANATTIYPVIAVGNTTKEGFTFFSSGTPNTAGSNVQGTAITFIAIGF